MSLDPSNLKKLDVFDKSSKKRVMLLNTKRDLLFAIYNHFLHCPVDSNEFTLLVNEFFTNIQDYSELDARRILDIANKDSSAQKSLLVILKSKWQQYVHQEGNKLLQSMQRKIQQEDANMNKLYKEFVDEFLSLYDTMNQFITHYFDNDTKLADAMKQVFGELVLAEVEDKQRSLKANPATFIISYCDQVMRSISNSEDADAQMERIIALFKVIPDKDLIQEGYKRQMSRRLLSNTSASSQFIYDERSMLVKLKSSFGVAFTTKMEGMIRDHVGSQDLYDNFKSYLVKKKKQKDVTDDVVIQNVKFVPTVLTLGYWPSFHYNEKMHVPIEFQQCISEFNYYYKEHAHSGRTLTWVYSEGSVILQGLFQNGTYDFECNMVQACLLLSFNGLDGNVSHSLESISANTQLKPEEVKLVTSRLQKLNVLVQNSTNDNLLGDTSTTTTSFQVNANFKHKTRKVKLVNATITNLSKQEKQVLDGVVEQGRIMSAEAALVRIMKSRKQMTHKMLVDECAKQLLPFFVPDVKMIKARIESLLAREYIERDENDTEVYRYVA